MSIIIIVMKKYELLYQKLFFTEKSAPLAFLIVCILAFGLMIPSLGFYMDDWPYVFYAYNIGIDSLREMLLYDSRPYAAWLYILAFKILGFNPIYWHFAALLMRWVTVILFWKILTEIWPKRVREATSAALLFAVYPFFMLQPFAVGSTHHWAGFIFFNLSLYLMVLAYKHGKYTAWLTPAALILQATHLFTSEYFSGLEFLRPVIFWILISRGETKISRRFGKVFLHWLPYFIILGAFAYWRINIFKNVEGATRNVPVILIQLFTEPLQAVKFLVTVSIKDAVTIMTIGWQKATSPETMDLSSVFAVVRLLISAMSFVVAYIYLSKFQTPTEEDNSVDNWAKESSLFAATGLMIGGLPVWLIGSYILRGKNLLSASRFGLPTMPSAAFLLTLVIDYFISVRNKKIVFLSLCMALAINFHLANTKDFQVSWEKQIRFSEQLLWRAPTIEAGTSILTDEEVLGIMGEYAVSFSIITTYQPGKIQTPPYWYFPFYYTNFTVSDLLQGAPLDNGKLSMNFSGNSNKMLLLSFNPELNRCLWILSLKDTNLRLVSSDMRQLSAGSDIDLIHQTSGTEPTLPESIYGTRNKNTWCYYFEKADLARQYQQWNEVTKLWNEAQANGERADNGFEYIPFIEGFGHQENWEQVKLLTKFADRITAGLESSLCSTLDRLSTTAPASSESIETIKNLKDDLTCANYQ